MIACEFCARDSTVSAKMYAKIISRLFWPVHSGAPWSLSTLPTPRLRRWLACAGAVSRAGILTHQTARHTHARNRFVNRKTRIIGGGGGARGRRKWNEGAGWKVGSAVLRSVDVGGGGGKHRATIRIDSRGRIEAAVFDSVQPVLLCDGTSRYGVPENLTTG